jgi:hypothetical protein
LQRTEIIMNLGSAATAARFVAADRREIVSVSQCAFSYNGSRYQVADDEPGSPPHGCAPASYLRSTEKEETTTSPGTPPQVASGYRVEAQCGQDVIIVSDLSTASQPASPATANQYLAQAVIQLSATEAQYG